MKTAKPRRAKRKPKQRRPKRRAVGKARLHAVLEVRRSDGTLDRIEGALSPAMSPRADLGVGLRAQAQEIKLTCLLDDSGARVSALQAKAPQTLVVPSVGQLMSVFVVAVDVVTRDGGLAWVEYTLRVASSPQQYA